MLDKFREECGVFGIFGHAEASNLTYLGLYALQHRGQESAGIAASDGSLIRVSKAVGYVNDVFNGDTLAKLPGTLAVGHVRYSTAGDSGVANAQPIVVDSFHGQLALAHNGNLVNAGEVRDALIREGAIFQTSADSEVLVHLFARSKGVTAEAAIIDAISQVRGAFSLVMMTKDRLVGVRDPHGFRPLVLGKLRDAWVLSSETCALDLIGASYVRDVEPGEIVVVSDQGLKSSKPFAPARRSQCVFEHVYFARPDSYVFGESVNEVRTEFGRRLARESGVAADVVVPIPDSGVCAAVGFAEASGIPMRFGLIRNHYVGRTFIEPQQSIRHFGVRVKLNPVRSILEGRRVVLVDDSIVRGTTSRKIVRMVRSAGATEVHMRISCPPTISPCFYGVDTPRRSELIAATHTIEEIRRYLDADSVSYLSLDGLTGAVQGGKNSYCTSCYTGEYPVAFPRDEAAYLQLALKLKPETAPSPQPVAVPELEQDPVPH
uniref:Amidophosphoribosyltransferase n=1 Tax=uncultured Acidobacteriota bacterium TaxID=171953 RepID=Q7X2X5_9BACT|nr:putative amidophosphoribosyl transferase [uncultured Acidobacteriota bacterium]